MIYMAGQIIITDDITLLKISLSKELRKQRFSQEKISKILKLTQPMVSNYLSIDKKIPEHIKTHSRLIVEKIKKNKLPLFRTCVTFSEVSGKYYLARPEELMVDDKKSVIDDILRALNEIKDLNIKNLIPKVKINLAMSKENANTKRDIASVEGGLSFIEGRLSYFGSVGFDKSDHLASLLIYLKNISKGYNSIMNIKFDTFLLRSELKARYLSKDFKLASKDKDIDILLHKGGFGIEPCAYILGKDASDVIEKIRKII